MAENEVSVQLALKIDKAQQSLDKIQGQISNFSDNTSSFFGKSTAAWASFKGSIAADVIEKGLEKAADAGRELFDTFVVEGVQAAEKQEDAVNALNIALQAQGLYTRQTSKDMQAFADQQQRTTTFSNDVILSADAMLESYAKLDEQGLKRATIAAENLSAATHGQVGLDTAMELLGRAAQGQIGTLSRYGIIVKQGASNAETFNNVLTKLNSGGFSGAAVGQVRTFSGAVEQSKNAFEDLQKATGNYIILNPVAIKLVHEITGEFQMLTDEVGKNKGEVLDLVDGSLVALVDGFGYTLIAIDGAERGLKGLWQAGGLVFDGLTVVVTEFADDFISEWARALGWVPKIGPALNQAKKDVETFSAGAKQQFADDGKAMLKTFSQEGDMGKMGDSVLDFGKKLEQFAQKNKKLNDQNTQSDRQSAAQQKDIFSDLIDFYSGENAKRVEDLKSTMTDITQLMNDTNGALFVAGQAAALSNIAINTADAAAKALTAAPPPFNFVLEGLVIAEGLAQAAKVVSTPPPAKASLAEGGIVPGGSTTGDRVPVMANSGEMYLTPAQQANLFSAIVAGPNSGSSTVHFNVEQFIGTEAFFDQVIVPGIKRAVTRGAVLTPKRSV